METDYSEGAKCSCDLFVSYIKNELNLKAWPNEL